MLNGSVIASRVIRSSAMLSPAGHGATAIVGQISARWSSSRRPSAGYSAPSMAMPSSSASRGSERPRSASAMV